MPPDRQSLTSSPGRAWSNTTARTRRGRFVAGSADLRLSGQAVHLQYKLPSQHVALEGADGKEIASAFRFLQHECETE